MPDPLPADIVPGAIGRDPGCPACQHAHLWLPCSCGCEQHLRNGVD
jgi:hypothetical protein